MSIQEHKQQSGIRINFFISTPAAILIGSFIIATAILINGGIIKFKGSTVKTTTGAQAVQAPAQPAGQAAQAPTQPSGPVKVDLADAPVLGKKDAPVTLVKFSDYYCPFFKKSYDQLLP